MRTTHIAAIAALLSLGACRDNPAFNPTDFGTTGGTGGSGGDDGGVLGDGVQICAEVRTATWRYTGRVLSGDVARDEDGDGVLEYPRQCTCVPLELAADLEAAAGGGYAPGAEVVVTGAASQELQDLRDALLFGDVQIPLPLTTICRLTALAIASEAVPDSFAENLVADDCATVITTATPLFERPGMCPRKGYFDSYGGDSWTDFYSAAAVITSGPAGPQIDADFYDDVRANPQWLMADGARIELIPGVPGITADQYELVNVAVADLVYELGFRSGDRLVSIDGNSIEGFDDALAAFEDTAGASSVTVVVSRPLPFLGRTNLTFTFTIV
jgi:hypothetical protein